MSIRDLAAATGISPAQISNIETAKATSDLRQLMRFAEVLDVPLVQLLPHGGVRLHFRGSAASSCRTDTAVFAAGAGPGPRWPSDTTTRSGHWLNLFRTST